MRCWGGLKRKVPLVLNGGRRPEVEGRSAHRRSHRLRRSWTPAAPGNSEETRLSPSVRRACLQHGIDPARIQGTGRNGRMTREDVDRAVASATVVSVGEPTIAELRAFSPHDIPHDRMRLTIAENMVRAVAEAPHVTAVFEADFSAIATDKAAMSAKGVKLSYTAYIVEAAAEAMAVAPAINGRWEKDRVAISPTIDIGVGTALGEKGLVVPVVKDAGNLSLEQIGAKLDDLTRRARDGKLERADVSGGSFTISNHGVSGSLLAAPIILHQGQAAILGIGKLQKRAVVREIDGEDAIFVRPMAYVTLTIDHRVVDGHQTNAWLTPLRRNHRELAAGLDVGLLRRNPFRNCRRAFAILAPDAGAETVAGHRQRSHRIAPDDGSIGSPAASASPAM